MKWTKQKPKTYGVFWWKKWKKSKAYLVYVEDAKLSWKKCSWVSIIFPNQECDSLIFDEEACDQFDALTDIEDVGGYWSDTEIKRPSALN